MKIEYVNKRPTYAKAVVSVVDHVECRCQDVPRLPPPRKKSSRKQHSHHHRNQTLSQGQVDTGWTCRSCYSYTGKCVNSGLNFTAAGKRSPQGRTAPVGRAEAQPEGPAGGSLGAALEQQRRHLYSARGRVQSGRGGEASHWGGCAFNAPLGTQLQQAPWD